MALFVLLICASGYLSAQSEAALREYFEGKTVIVKQDLPANKVGIDIYPDSAPAINYVDYGRRLKQFGVALRRNESVAVTGVRVRDKSIELQLGDGLSAPSDDSSPAVYVAADKTQREKMLEREVEREVDPERKEKMQQELDSLRKQRLREDARLKAALAQVAASSEDPNRQRAISSGAHVNLVFPAGVPTRALSPEYVMGALKSWIDFNAEERPSPPPVAPEEPTSAAALRKGLSEAELQRMFGDPVKREPGEQGDLRVEILTFKHNGTTVEATMVEGVLVRFKQWSY